MQRGISLLHAHCYQKARNALAGGAYVVGLRRGDSQPQLKRFSGLRSAVVMLSRFAKLQELIEGPLLGQTLRSTACRECPLGSESRQSIKSRELLL